ncbi:hypothetical protein B0H10DRAFT_2227752 [Mycena sp. CBHHK59/15]|nr:hypothetical protein B0H10DRAFT_2227752 [Mycena sp. CBHHK59/15]
MHAPPPRPRLFGRDLALTVYTQPPFFSSIPNPRHHLGRQPESAALTHLLIIVRLLLLTAKMESERPSGMYVARVEQGWRNENRSSDARPIPARAHESCVEGAGDACASAEMLLGAARGESSMQSSWRRRKVHGAGSGGASVLAIHRAILFISLSWSLAYTLDLTEARGISLGAACAVVQLYSGSGTRAGARQDTL